MSKFISFLFLCFASLATFAQVADLKVSYNYQHYSPDGKGINSQMVGFLAGAGVGTVTLPIVGTVSGGALGGWSGALVGVASFC